MSEEFISEEIEPVKGTFDTKLMSFGTPGIPRVFFWRGKEYQINEILRSWRTTGPCRHGNGEQYVRRHWFEVSVAPTTIMKIYFDKGLRGKQNKIGWYIFSVAEKSALSNS